MSRSATGIAILFTLLAIIETAFTTGTMTVKNHCSYDVWMQVVPQGPVNPPWELIPSTGVGVSPPPVIPYNTPSSSQCQIITNTTSTVHLPLEPISNDQCH